MIAAQLDLSYPLIRKLNPARTHPETELSELLIPTAASQNGLIHDVSLVGVP